MREFVRAVDRLSTALAVVAAAFVLAAVLIVTYMIVVRLLGASNYWEIELSIYLSVGAIFLASPYALRTGGHVSVDLLPKLLPQAARPVLMTALRLVGLAVCVYLAWVSGERFLESFHTGERSNSLWKPLVWPLHLTMPVGLAMTALQFVVEILAPHRARDDAALTPL